MFIYYDIEKSMLKHIHFISLLLMLYTWIFALGMSAVSCETDQQLEQPNDSKHTSQFKLELCCKSSVCHLSNGKNYKLDGETSRVYSVPLEFL